MNKGSSERVRFKLLLRLLDQELAETPFPSQLYNERLADRNALVRFLKSTKAPSGYEENETLVDAEE